MVRHRRAAPAILLPLALAGCGGGGGGWVHGTKPATEFAQDEASCRQQSIEKVQSSHQKQEAPKWMTRAVGTSTYFFDGNDNVREQWHKSCLRAMGWASGGGKGPLPEWVSPELISAGIQYIVR